MNVTMSGEQPQVKGTVLVVDDDESVRRGLYWALNSDFRVLEASSRSDAVELLQREKIDVVVSDLHLPPHEEDISEGLAIIQAARSTHPPVQAVVITGTSSKHAALDAVKHGAYGFFEKPFDADEVRHIISQAARMRRLEVENARLRDELLNSRGFSHLIGGSQSLEKIVKHARAVAATSATVSNHRREWHRQGDAGTGDPRRKPQGWRFVYCGQLCSLA